MELGEIKNPALVSAMKTMKETNTREAQAQFMAELKNATFLTPALVEVKNENGECTYQVEAAPNQDSRLIMMMLENANGDKYLPAFTSMEELLKWRKEEAFQVVICNFEKYMNIIAKDPNGPKALVIDGYGVNIMLERDFIVGLKQAIDAKKN